MDLRGLSREEMTELVVSLGEPAYRARQIMAWIYRRGIADPGRMTDLPVPLRDRLALLACPCEAVLQRRQSADGTLKLLLACPDGVAFECVRLRYGYGYTACVSSQAGCAGGCAFCRSGEGGLERNLTAGEMVGQVLALNAAGGRPITRVVLMGGGEPLANYAEVLRFLRLATSSDGLGLSPRRITVSTSGVVPGIRRLAGEGLPVTLSVSLHAADDRLRDRLVPVNRRWPLAELLAACRDWARLTGRRVSAEYVLIGGVNDRPEDAARLARLARGTFGHINLIALNPVPGFPHPPPSREAVAAFARQLRRSGVPVTVRRPLGRDIDGACGQLRASSRQGPAAGATNQPPDPEAARPGG